MTPTEPPSGAPPVTSRLDSIKSRIVMLAVLATLVPAVSTAILSYVQNRQALTETREAELRGTGSQAAREIDLWVKQRSYDVRVFVSSFEVTENLARMPGGGSGADEAAARLTNYLRGVQGLFPDYVRMVVIGPDGEPVTAAGADLAGEEVPPEWAAPLQRGQTRLGEPYRDEELAEIAVKLAQPVVANGEYLGALVTTVTFDAVEIILGGFAPGEGGRIDMVLSDGRRIVGSHGADGLALVVSEAVLAELRRVDGGTVEYTDEDGTAMLGTLTEVPTLDWSIVAQIPTREAYAQVARLRDSTMVLVSLLVVVAGGIAYLLGLVIVRPLDRLATAADAVADGDLSVDLPVTGGGEVGHLTSVFNDMVRQLRESREELDDASEVLREQNVELERLSLTDLLTGLYNRRHVMAEFDKELQRAERYDREVAVLMLDVDRFKQYNDTHGHLAGDDVLAALGRVLEDATRDHDVPGRFGGEEFIALLPDCGLDGAVEAAERIRTRLREEVFEGGAVTCSIGAAVYPTHGASPHTLIAAADAALYEAKAQGRDRVVAASAPPGPARRSDPTKKRRPASTKKGATKRGATKKKAAPKTKAVPAKKGASKSAAAKKGASKSAAAKKGATKRAVRKTKPSKRSTPTEDGEAS